VDFDILELKMLAWLKGVMKHAFSADSVKELEESWPKRAFRRNYQNDIHSMVIQDFYQDFDDVGLVCQLIEHALYWGAKAMANHILEEMALMVSSKKPMMPYRCPRPFHDVDFYSLTVDKMSAYGVALSQEDEDSLFHAEFVGPNAGITKVLKDWKSKPHTAGNRPTTPTNIASPPKVASQPGTVSSQVGTPLDASQLILLQ
jgi:hypothetical protein